MTTELVQKLEGIRDFRKILETVVKDLSETYSCDISSIALSNPLNPNLTSICEYKLYPEAVADELPVSVCLPLPLEGQLLGAVRLARQVEFHENEINWIRITLAELSDVIRHAQINDVVQRETFRETFLIEIRNVMQYSLGIGDALFMVVNILGKLLNVSRCLFICVDDSQAGWKCYEFWQRDRVQSCKEYGWPTTDSPIVARSLLAGKALVVEEANQNSYLTPVQEELQLLGVRSLFGVPIKSEHLTHGCIILQHGEVRHAWTRGEVDLVQNVADTIAEALVKLPEEKRAREPIMRLHQREITPSSSGSNQSSILAVRRALRGALGNSSIPSASSSTAAAQRNAPAQTAQTAPAAQPGQPEQLDRPVQNASAKIDQQPTPMAQPVQTPEAVPQVDSVPVAPPPQQAIAVPDSASGNSSVAPTSNLASLGNSIVEQAGYDATNDEISQSLQSLLGGLGLLNKIQPQPAVADRDLTGTQNQAQSQLPAPSSGNSIDAGSGAMTGAQAQLQADHPPETDAAASPWGDLNSIPTPSQGPVRGLGGSMFNASKRSSNSNASSSLLASLHRDKSKFQPAVEYVDGGTLQIDEQEAQQKLKQILSTVDATSDYIFALPGLDARMLGRIDGWITEVESKDKYSDPHARAVAQYSVDIGKQLGLPEAEINQLRLSAVLHDVGKLGLSANLLQKPEDELSDTELLWVMKHTVDGAKLLEGFPELAHLAPIVLSHHEDYDGNGYPEGLVGEQIPLESRIIHAASDYHNLVSPTKGRAATSASEAQQTLRSYAGKIYDPSVVEALIAALATSSGQATNLPG